MPFKIESGPRPGTRGTVVGSLRQMAVEVPPEATAYRHAGKAGAATQTVTDDTECECGATWRFHNHAGHRLSLMAGSRCEGFRPKES